MKKLSIRQQQYNETHNRIFDSAMALFSYRSYEEITINEICKMSDVSVGAFYHHFQAKENILNEGYRQFDNLIEAKMNSQVFASNEDAIYSLIESQLQCIQSLGAFTTMQYFKHQLTTKEKYIINTDRGFYLTLNQYIQKWLKEHDNTIDSAIVVEKILRASRGTIYDWCLHDGKYDLVQVGLETIKIILFFYINNKSLA